MSEARAMSVRESRWYYCFLLDLVLVVLVTLFMGVIPAAAAGYQCSVV